MRDFREPTDIYPKLTPGLGHQHVKDNARRDHQRMNSATIAATIECKRIIDPSILSSLARNCPGLKTFNWQAYLDCSRIRVKRVLEALEYYYLDAPNFVSQLTPKILDFGSWLGNFSMALHYEGYSPTSAEMWMRYSPALDAQKKMLADNGVDCIDTTMIVGRPQGPTYNTVLLMSVIEHLSCPRKILQILHQALKPGGLLILDTPNLAYLPNRRALRRGHSPYVPIAEQFYSEEPFEGHVREYTSSELHWMLQVSGFEILETDFFNYSPTPLSSIPLLDHVRMLFPPYRQSPIVDRLKMWLDPRKRELIFIVARKK